MRSFLSTPWLLILSITPISAAIDFEKKVVPIFADHCYKCHGESKQKADLRLDSPGGTQVETLQNWIDEGANMPGTEDLANVKMTTDHWSFEPIR